MFKLKSISQSNNVRTLVAAIRSQYSDVDHVIRISISDDKSVALSPDISDLEWHLNKDRESFLDDLRDFISEWS